MKRIVNNKHFRKNIREKKEKTTSAAYALQRWF